MRSKALVALGLVVVAALGMLLVWAGAQSGQPPERDSQWHPPISDAAGVTKNIAGMAFGSECSGVRTDGTIGVEKLTPRVEGEMLVLRSPTLVEAHASIPLPEWLDPSAMQDALDEVTPQGMFERTGDWYDQPDFTSLTGDELARLVPNCVELGYSFGGDRTLLDFVGGLPSLADCERGFADVDVQRALAAVVMIEIPKSSLSLTPYSERSEQWQRDFDVLCAAYEQRELDLARELERVTGYAHWSILRRAFVAWGR